MKKSVGLIIFTHIKDSNGQEVLAAVLQRRGTYNFEEMKPETYPGCHQVTAHGNLNNGENFEDAFTREINEELGVGFAVKIASFQYAVVAEIQNDEKQAITKAVCLPIYYVRSIRLEPGSGGLDPITYEQMKSNPPIPISKEMKLNGPPSGMITLFSDEIEALQKGFALFI